MGAIQGYEITLKEHVYQQKEPNIPEFSITEMVHLEKCIEKLKNMNVIKVTTNEKNQFVSSYFIVPKPDGSYRFILNFKKFNEFVNSQHFKMEDIRTAINILQRDDFMCSIDLKDAYFMIPVKNKYRKYLKFNYKNIMYEFTALPFGLSTCPYVYSKIMKPVLALFRSKGIRITNYLDDFLIFGKSMNECQENTKFIKDTLTNLGFVINFKKSVLEPTKICKYLGFLLN